MLSYICIRIKQSDNFNLYSYLSATPNVGLKKLLRDLGLGKETNFEYPWHPKAADNDNVCKDPTFKEEIPGTWDTTQDLPGTKCSEYIFTRA